ncbi:hypothetical protein Hanom_Chr02g00095441 [Helianthus anomalus]
MYKLFAAAQAIEFSVGCHARWSNFVVKSNEFPLASTSPPVDKKTDTKFYEFWSNRVIIVQQQVDIRYELTS